MTLCTHMGRGKTTAIAAALLISLSVAAFAGDRSDKRYGKIEKMRPFEQIEYLRGLESDGERGAELYYHMGNAFYSLEQPDSSITYLRMATRIDTTYSRAWVNLGIAYDTSRRRRDARDAYNHAIAVNPNDVLAYCHLGFNYFEGGDVDRAVKLYGRALEIDPDSAQARYNLGLAFADAKLFHEALIEWNRVVELDPDGQLGKIAAENAGLIQTYLELDN